MKKYANIFYYLATHTTILIITGLIYKDHNFSNIINL